MLCKKRYLLGDPALIMEFGKSFIRRGLASGLALAKLMFELEVNWYLFKAAGYEGTAEEHVTQDWGYSSQTFKKYVNMWESIFNNTDVTETARKLLMGRPIGDLLLLTAAVREGQISGENLEKAALAPDRASLREAIQGAGRTPSAKAITLKVVLSDTDRNYAPGTLLATQNGETVVVGYFVLNDSDALISTAQEQIKARSHMLEVM